LFIHNLPVIDAGMAMYSQLGSSKANWSDYYYNSVHPLDAGHAVFANEVKSVLGDVIGVGNKEEHELFSEKLSSNAPDTVELLTRNSFEPFQWGTLDSSVWGANTWFANDSYEISGSPLRSSLNKCFASIMPKYIYPQYDGAELEFNITGNSVGIIGILKEGQSLTAVIDGKDSVTITGSNRTEMTEYPLFINLENTAHTVKFTANGNGPYIAIAAVVVGK